MIEAILEQVTRISLPLIRLVSQKRLGEHRSRQRGSGFDFDQIKEYQQGEPVRKVNWAATARKGNMTPLINTYYEDRNSTVMLLVDLSTSMDFGSQRVTKKTLAAEICASLVYSALVTHECVGYMGFAAGVETYLPPRQSWRYQRAIPEQILTSQVTPAPVSFSCAVTCLEKWLKQPSLIFLLSDFLTEQLGELRQSLRKLKQRHDLIPVLIADPLELSLPARRARIITRDLETGKTVHLSFTRKNQRAIEGRMRSRQLQLGEIFESLQMDHLTITANSNYAEDLSQLFLSCHRKASA